MTKQPKLPATGLRIDSIPASQRRFAAKGWIAAENLPMRIARGDQVIGKWPANEIKERLGRGELLPTDLFYDQDLSDWLPLSELRAKAPSVNSEKTVTRLCYCGTGLPFQVCCGDGSVY
jgi:hypothetical protein